ncbi:MAG: hypothetical protein A3J29_10730 [Acidobacteria bacterium RIFCSPLOWO2_12_FULL_67_14b]|nr:MAG: hypothetical protein A3J29_10730 [Acidobacteria bacterium RIFCSPLOWO2_12_FULL_67_14b]
MKQTLLAAALAVVSTVAPSAMQPVAPTAQNPAVVPLYQAPVDAHATREQLQEILRQYPPAVGEVLRRDPSLLTRADYLAPYPQLVAFLQQHPEITRNASFYFGGFDYQVRREPMSPEIEALGVLLGGLAGVLGAGAFLGVLTWLVRAVIQHRRWLRLSKVQAEVHTKLMDRLTTNEELLAYIQSPAGRRFLESAPIQSESDAPRHGAPVGPIIWSMMAGIVLAMVGAGFRYAAQSVTNDAHQAFTVVGVIILALGAGFILASIMAYLVSSRLGLFPQRPSPDPSAGNA